MAAIVYQTNKKTGVIYAYESVRVRVGILLGQGKEAVPGKTKMRRKGRSRHAKDYSNAKAEATGRCEETETRAGTHHTGSSLLFWGDLSF